MEIQLTTGNKYLIRKLGEWKIQLITMLYETNTSYKFLFESGDTDWFEKSNFIDNYVILEDVTNLIPYYTPQNYDGKYLSEIDFKECDCCFGMGTIPSKDSTIGTKICPKCCGSKRVLK